MDSVSSIQASNAMHTENPNIPINHLVKIQKYLHELFQLFSSTLPESLTQEGFIIRGDNSRSLLMCSTIQGANIELAGKPLSFSQRGRENPRNDTKQIYISVKENLFNRHLKFVQCLTIYCILFSAVFFRKPGIIQKLDDFLTSSSLRIAKFQHHIHCILVD